MRTGVIRTEGGRETRQQGLGVGEFERGRDARHEEQILRPAKRAIDRGPAGEAVDAGGIVLAGIPEAEGSASLTVKDTQK